MPRPSPQTTRVIDTINLLTDASTAPDGGMTLTEIARDLPANVSSCVHLLAALTAAGWVVRDPDTKRYRVGPALVRPGRLAADRHPLLLTLHEEMTALTDQVQLSALAFRREYDADGGSRGRLIAMTWPRGQAPLALRIGDTVPIVAPLGAPFVAWDPDEDIQRWLADVEDGLHRQRLADDLAVIREAGYAVERDLRAGSNADLEALVDDRPSPYRDRLLYGLLAGPGDDRRVLTDLDRDELHEVHGIAALVHVGPVEVGIYVAGFTGPLRADEIVSIGRATQAVADRATSRLCALQTLGIDGREGDDRTS